MIKRLRIIICPLVFGWLGISRSLAHDCANQHIIERNGPSCTLHVNSFDDTPLHRIPNWTNVAEAAHSHNVVPIGSSIYSNGNNSQYFTGTTSVHCSVTEHWGVTVGVSASLKAEAKGVIIPVGVTWETTVSVEGEWGRDINKGWIENPDMNVPPCGRHRVVFKEGKTRIAVSGEGGDWERWSYYCPGSNGEITLLTLVCNYEIVEGDSVRFSEREIESGWAIPNYVAGCHDPSTGGGDTDGDGVPNIIDPDVDGDGLDNDVDPDIDGDGYNNNDPNETDMDGDGQPDSNDSDIDGDGSPNTDDADMDGDGIPNDLDDDMDGDEVPNVLDDDMDGDGVVNDEDDDPDGPSSIPLLIKLLLSVLQFIF